MGVSGGWGVGKSSMLKLISESLKEREESSYLFVDFNAWLYQGYDDARAALMEVIARKLIEHGGTNGSGLEKAKSLLGKVNWLRFAGLATGSVLSLTAGVPPIWMLGSLISTLKGLADNQFDEADLDAIQQLAKSIPAASGEVSTRHPDVSPPRQIQDLRQHFEETLCEMNVTLVVFIDDLDRCLPDTAVATLEAVRLFLFLPRTAFVIAADDQMIRQAVRVHFSLDDVEDALITNYFDKLIQVPLRVPPLGTQEVRAYLILLFLENSGLDSEKLEGIREQICNRLSESWRGHRVDLHFVHAQLDDCSEALRANLELADRLAPLMTTASQISGNPRLIKRFLNTLSIRMSVAKTQSVSVDGAALAKMLLFERCAGEEAYTELVSAINESAEGKPSLLAEWERQARAGEIVDQLPTTWDTPFVIEWLALSPAFAEMDLRSVVYVSREHMPIVTSADQLSSEASGILEALLALEGGPSNVLRDRLRALTGREVALIMERLMVRARQEQGWGTPQILWALLTVIDTDDQHAATFIQLLESVPRVLLQADIIPVLSDREWARAVLDGWRGSSRTPQPVRKAIDAMTRQV